jgi:shikimate dehydrogenase
LHRAALHAMDLVGDYQLYPVPPFPEGERSLRGLLERLRNNELVGLNVTIPHKQTIIPFLDELAPTASAIGAVNTVYVQGGKLVGENTDAAGFLADLERSLRAEIFDRDALRCSEDDHEVEKYAILLGAGGAARAAAYALMSAGWEVIVAARRLEQAEQITSSLQPIAHNLRRDVNRVHFSVLDPKSFPSSGSITAVLLDKPSMLILQTKIPNQKPIIVVNATPVGMWPGVNDSPWPNGVPFPTGALIYDLVYNPRETALMRASHLAGLSATNGLGMLIEQAALALEAWTGQNVPRKPMWEAVSEFPGSFHE